MRMTDRVLNASALSSGLAVNNVSLVNQLGKNRQDSLLDALEKGSSASTGKKENYSKLRKAAEQLAQRTEELAKEGEDSIFARAKASGDREELSQSLQEFAKNYNDTLKRLRGTGAPLDVYYSQMLQEAAKDNSKALAGVGITFGRDGSMQIAKEALEKADLEELESLFGASGRKRQRRGKGRLQQKPRFLYAASPLPRYGLEALCFFWHSPVCFLWV